MLTYNVLALVIVLAKITLIACQDYRNHPCIRECSASAPMKCVYDFTVDWHTVLGRHCLNCTYHTSDCFRSGCVTAAGIPRSIKVVNKMLPGPAIQVCRGDEIVVNVANKLHSFEAISIHWHGLKQSGTPHMDGIAMITQCPILPFTTFQYRFEAKDRGTYFWHAHSSGQRGDGIFGALIVRDDASDVNIELYDADRPDHVIVINDWSNQIFIDKYAMFVNSHGSESIDDVLINGRGVDVNPANEAKSLRTFDAPRAEFFVDHGLRYRFRMINAGIQFCPLELSVDEHSLLLIAVDGNPIGPLEVQSIILGAGERVDFVLHADQEPDNYWIKVKGLADCELNEIFQTAILRYDASDTSLPAIKIDYDTAGPTTLRQNQLTTYNPLNMLKTDESLSAFTFVNQLVSHPSDAFNRETLKTLSERSVDRTFYLTVDMLMVKNPHVYDDFTFAYEKYHDDKPWRSPQINNISFSMPYTSLLYPIKEIPHNKFCNDFQRAPACSTNVGTFCECIHLLEVKLDEIVELIIVDGGTQGENHPIHLHGHSFAVIGQEKIGDSLSLDLFQELDRSGKVSRNLVNPPFKDTLMNPSGGYSIIRFHAYNPGFWTFHCHVDFHSEAGMMMVIKVGDESDMPPKPDNWPTCGNYAT